MVTSLNTCYRLVFLILYYLFNLAHANIFETELSLNTCYKLVFLRLYCLSNLAHGNVFENVISFIADIR